MNQERKDQLLTLVRIAFVVGFAYLYSEGGMHDKWLRRFVAPCELSIGMFIFSRDWRVFLQMPLMMGSLCLGYGADETWLKIVKRLIWGLANGASSSVYIAILSLSNSMYWFLFSLHHIILVFSVVCLGVLNPLANARNEEFTIGLLIALIPIMVVKDKK